MLRVARQSISHRLPVFVASFFALGFAALLVTVSGGLLETGIRADVPPQRLVAAPIVVTGAQGYRGESLVERGRVSTQLQRAIADVPGVRNAIGDVSFPANVFSGGHPLAATPFTGHGWSSARLTPFTLTAGSEPSDADDVVIDAALAQRLHAFVGSQLEGLARGEPVSLRVVGIAAAAGDQAPTLFVSDARAAAIVDGSGAVDSVGVLVDASVPVSAVKQRIVDALRGQHLSVFTGIDRGRAEFLSAGGQTADLIPLSGAAGGCLVAVSVFIVASTLALSVQLRRRQIALLRAVGATPGQLRRLVLGETVLLAIPSVGLALLPSRWLGRRLLAAFADHGVVPARLVYHQGVIPMLAGAGVAVLTGVVAALVAARTANRVQPVEALRADAAPYRWITGPRIVFGVLTMAGGIALAIVTVLAFDGPIAASTATPAALLWAIGLALLAPVFAGPVLRGLAWLARLTAPRTGRLVQATIRARIGPTAALVTPVMLAVGLTTALLYLQTSQQSATDAAYARHLRADLILSAPAAGGLPLALADRVERIDGVAAASPLVTSTGFFDARPGTNPEDADPVPLLGLADTAAEQVTDYPMVTGRLADLHGAAVAISQSEQAPGRHLGDMVTVRFGDNRAQALKIVAVVASPRGYPTMLLPAELLSRHTTTGLAHQILVATSPTADLAQVERAIGDVEPALVVKDRAAALSKFSDDQQTGAWVAYLLVAVLIVYTGVSLINITVSTTTQRRTQLRSVRRIGASRALMVRAMTIEATVVAGAGIVLGTALALATLLPFDSALGAPGLPAGSVWIYVITCAGAAGLTVGTTRLSARFINTSPDTVT